MFPSVFWGNCYRMKENEGVKEGTGKKLKASGTENPMYSLRHVSRACSSVYMSSDSHVTCTKTNQAVMYSYTYAILGISSCICN